MTPTSYTKHNGSGQQAIYTLVTERILASLKAGTVPWHRPWTTTGGLPLSMATGKAYRGINVFMLGLTAQTEGYTSPYWGTYDQIANLGGQVRKGQHSTQIVFWKRLRKDVTTATGETETRWIPMLRYFRVFNASQADGLPAKYYPATVERPEPERLTACQAVLDDYLARGPRLIAQDPNRAYYRPSTDEINLPPLSSFETAPHYYATAFHEAGHSTGHETRLARKNLLTAHRFGDTSYSQEELVAEMTAAMLCAVTGIDDPTHNQSAAYIASWLRALGNDHKMVVTAAAQAQKAADLIQGITYSDEASDDTSGLVEASPGIAAGRAA